MGKYKSYKRLLSLVLISALTCSSFSFNTIKAAETDGINKQTSENQEEKTNEVQTYANNDLSGLKLEDGPLELVVTKDMKNKSWSEEGGMKEALDQLFVKNIEQVPLDLIKWEYSSSGLIFYNAENGSWGIPALKDQKNEIYKLRVKTGGTLFKPTYAETSVNLTTSYEVKFESPESHGKIKVNGEVKTKTDVTPNESLSFTIEPDEFYSIEKVELDGNSITPVNGQYTIDTVNADKNVKITYALDTNIKTFSIHKSGKGDVYKNGEKLTFKNDVSTFKVKSDQVIEFTFTPAGATMIGDLQISPATYIHTIKLNDRDQTLDYKNFSTDGSRSYKTMITPSTNSIAVDVSFLEAKLAFVESPTINFYKGLSKTDIENRIKALVDTDQSMPLVNPTIRYDASLFTYKPLDYVRESILDVNHEFGYLSSETIRIDTSGDNRYPAITYTKQIKLEDNRKQVNIILNDDVTMKYNTKEQMDQILYETLLSSVKDNETGEEISYTKDDFTFDFTAAVGEQNVKVSYKGNDAYTTTSSNAKVTIEKGDVKVSVPAQNITYGDAVTTPVVTTNPANVDNITVFVGIDGNINGFASLLIPDSIRKLLDIPILNQYNPYQMIKAALEGGASLPEFKKLINDLLSIADYIPGVNIPDVVDQIMELLNKAPDMNMHIYLEQLPQNAGLYLAGAVTTDPNYNTAFGIGYMTISPKSKGISLGFNQNMENNTIEYNGMQDFMFGGRVNDGDKKITENVKATYVGFSADGKFHFESSPILEPGVYTETIFVLGGNYITAPIIRSYTIQAPKIEIRFDQSYVEARYDGTMHGLTAGVFMNDTRIADAEITYTGLESNLTYYSSNEAPIDAGLYQVSAHYQGENKYLSATNYKGVVFIKKSTNLAIFKVNNYSTTVGGHADIDDVTYSTSGLVERDVQRIADTLSCAKADTSAGSHKITVNVSKDVQKNYYLPIIAKNGTHTIKGNTKKLGFLWW